MYIVWFVLTDSLRVTVQCSDVAEVYIDGRLVLSGGSLWTGITDDDAQVIAVDCSNRDGHGGITAFFDNGLTTDSTWRCSGEVDIDVDWSSSSFDDSGWQPAHIIDYDELNPQLSNNNFRSHAKWIWKDKNNNHRYHSYCRGKLREFDETKLCLCVYVIAKA